MHTLHGLAYSTWVWWWRSCLPQVGTLHFVHDHLVKTLGLLPIFQCGTPSLKHILACKLSPNGRSHLGYMMSLRFLSWSCISQPLITIFTSRHSHMGLYEIFLFEENPWVTPNPHSNTKHTKVIVDSSWIQDLIIKVSTLSWLILGFTMNDHFGLPHAISQSLAICNELSTWFKVWSTMAQLILFRKGEPSPSLCIKWCTQLLYFIVLLVQLMIYHNLLL
jgi:hypothetical protein